MRRLVAIVVGALVLTGIAQPSTASAVSPQCDPTGKTDVAGCLNAFFAALPDNSVVTLPRGARYRAEEKVTLLAKRGVLLQGAGATLFATTRGDRGRAHLSLINSEDITVRGLRIVGPNKDIGPDGTYIAGLEAQAGVDIRGSVRVLLSGLRISNVYGDFVYISKLVKVRNASDITVQGGIFNGAGRQGIAITGANRVLLERNSIRNSRRSVIDLEPPTTADSVSDVTILRNTFSAGRFNFVAAAVGGAVNNVWVLHNRGIGKTLSVFVWDKNNVGRVNWRVEGNVSDEPYGSLKKGVMLVRNGANVVFKNNSQPIQVGRSMVGLEVDGKTCGAQSSGNLLRDAVTGETLAQSDGEGTRPCPAGTPSGPPALPASPAVPTADPAAVVSCSSGCDAGSATTATRPLRSAGVSASDQAALLADVSRWVTVLLSTLTLDF